MSTGRVVTLRAQGTDEQLALAAQAGDTRAAEALLRRYEPFLKTLARPFFDQSGSVDDIFQEARIGLLKAVRDWTPEGGASFKSFLTLAVTRQVITHVKFSTRRKHVQLTQAVRVAVLDDGERVDVLDTLEARRTDPTEIIGSRERFALVVAVLRDRLSGLERDSAISFFIDGESYETIAARRGVTAKSVDNALMRARAKLRLALDLPEPRPLGAAA